MRKRERGEEERAGAVSEYGLICACVKRKIARDKERAGEKTI